MNTTVSNRFWSNLVIAAWVLTFLFFLVVRPVWKLDKYAAPTSWDVGGYYLYLPAIFIHQDIRELRWKDSMMQQYEPASYFYFAHKHEKTGHFVCAYTGGMAMAYSPFFLIGHNLASISGYATDGYSLPYMLMLFISGGFYAGLGLLIARKLLGEFVEDRVVAIVLACWAFGTNWFYYSIFENGMTHTYLCTALLGFVWCAYRWYQTKQLRYAVGMGLLGGWAGITRPTELLIGLVFLLWGVASWGNFKTRLQELWIYKKHILTAAGIAFCIALPQILYWKWSANQWVYSGGYGGHHFQFLKPFILEGLFSIRKGWFVYTPIMSLAMLGFVPLYRQFKAQFWAILLFFLLNVWIVFSWSVWYYGGGFSARALVQSYGLLLFPMAALMQVVVNSRWKFIIYPFAVLCIVLNLFQSWQYRYGFIGAEGMSWYNYRLIFGKTSIDKDDIKRLEFQDIIAPASAQITKIIVQNDFSKDSTTIRSTQFAHSDTVSIVTSPAQRTIKLAQISIQNLNISSQQWLRATVWAYMENHDWSYQQMATLQAAIQDKNGDVYWQRYVKIPVLIGNDSGECHTKTYGTPQLWGKVWLDFQLPTTTQPTDTLIISIQNTGFHTLWIDDFSMMAQE